MRPATPLLSAVVPFLNEEKCLPELFRSLELNLGALGLAWELVLVDDGSTDRSLEVVQRELSARPALKATVLVLSRNFGKEAALTAGLEACRGDVGCPSTPICRTPRN